jgi:hypothetical protein
MEQALLHFVSRQSKASTSARPLVAVPAISHRSDRPLSTQPGVQGLFATNLVKECEDLRSFGIRSILCRHVLLHFTIQLHVFLLHLRDQIVKSASFRGEGDAPVRVAH